MTDTNQHSTLDDFATVREILNRWATIGLHDALTAVDRIEEQLATIEQERDDFEASQARLLHIIECADTPLMRDVLAERDGLKEQLESYRIGLRDLLDVAERTRGGDPSLDPEEWYAIRDYCKNLPGLLDSNPATGGAGAGTPPVDDGAQSSSPARVSPPVPNPAKRPT